MSTINLTSICVPSENVVARKIEGELIIVPLVSSVGDMDDELYTLNETGVAIWDRLDGNRTLQQIIDELIFEYEASKEDIERDVSGIVSELIKRKMLDVR
jgi:hypothetical protein